MSSEEREQYRAYLHKVATISRVAYSQESARTAVLQSKINNLALYIAGTLAFVAALVASPLNNSRVAGDWLLVVSALQLILLSCVVYNQQEQSYPFFPFGSGVYDYVQQQMNAGVTASMASATVEMFIARYYDDCTFKLRAINEKSVKSLNRLYVVYVVLDVCLFGCMLMMMCGY